MTYLIRCPILFAVALQVAAGNSDTGFDVATIRPHNPDVPGFGIRIRGRRLTTVGTSLSNLIAFAYSLHPRQIVGAPKWVALEKYDIVAEILGNEENVNGPAMIARAQKLLVDRFSLTFHRAERTLSVYKIVAGKSGPLFLNKLGDQNANPGYGFTGLGAMNVKDASVANFAVWLQRYVLDRPVLDRTGINGKYNFTLTWRPDEFQFTDIASSLPRAAEETDRSDLYTAMQQQLGLKLQAGKAAVEVLAVDHVERPNEN